ncbi:MAG TPA: T9SS type A sorting domain-containing protein, partial [Flavipsychrobacter sp.]|nr:T9SS type A sorting domain-containing protein [Flavipsychrobacter sp.]
VDNTPVPGTNYYRLLLKDVNNKTIYSEVVKAIVKTTGFTVEAYPNPVSNEMTVRVYGVKGAKGQVQITDLTGKVLKTVQMQSSEEQIDMSSLASGIYLMKYSDADHTQTVRVSKK